MPFGETKVYFDGSHYIAIPHTTRPSKKRPYKLEETITVIQDEVKDSGENTEPSISLDNEENIENTEIVEEPKIEETKPKKKGIFRKLFSKKVSEVKNADSNNNS